MSPIASRAAGIVVVALVAVAAASACAAAQAGALEPQVTVSLPARELAVDAGSASSVEATVTNAGAFDGAVTISVPVLDGWIVSADPESFDLASGESRTVTIDVTAPAAGEGAESGDLVFGATLMDAAGRTASADAALAASRTDPPPPPPAGPDPVLVGAGVVLVLGAVAGVVAWVRKRRRERAAYLDRETGIVASLEGSAAPFGNGAGSAFRVVLRNESARPRTAVVGVREAPEGWRVGFTVSRVTLDAGASVPVTVTVRPPDEVPKGTASAVVLFAKPEEALELEERVSLDVVVGRVRGPPRTIPAQLPPVRAPGATGESAPLPSLRR